MPIFLSINLYLPRGIIAVLLNIGIVVVVCTRLIITKELRESNEWFFDKSLKGIGNSFVKIISGIFIVYGIVICILSLFGMFSSISINMTKEDYVIGTKKLYMGLFSLLMICYVIEFYLIYLFI